MRFLKQSTRKNPKVSLILLDWSVRESFHLLHYLGKQTVERDQFEVIFIEYYSREAQPLRQFAEQVDTWALLEMPESCIYHKHLMYNCGIVFCHGEIVVICDSDAIVKDSFIQTIIDEFDKNNRLVLHLDQFRNSRKDFYPFNYPSFDEVLGEGCINNVEGKTEGIRDTVDPLHSRNYGACMCARRADLIAIGGADEHIDYLGHICGPYEMTFRLVNYGLEEIWHGEEFLYHTWHPGQAGVDNYQGPHDGMQMSSTALAALIFQRVLPLTENKVIQRLRLGENVNEEAIENNLINKEYLHNWDLTQVKKRSGFRNAYSRERSLTDLYRGIKITQEGTRYKASWMIHSGPDEAGHDLSGLVLESPSLDGILKQIDRKYPHVLRFSEILNSFCSLCRIVLSRFIWGIVRLVGNVHKWFKKALEASPERSSRIDSEKASSPKMLVEFYKKYKTGLLAVLEYAAYTIHWTNSLIANLYVMKHRVDVYGYPPVLLTTSLHLQLHLTALRMARLLPAIRIQRLKDRNAIKAYLEALPYKHYTALILARDLYTRHYGLIRSYLQSEDTVVL